MDHATRFQLALGAAAFVAWGLFAWSDVLRAEAGVASFDRVFVHVGLLAVAGFGNLVTGLAWHLAGTLWGRRAPPAWWRAGTGVMFAVAGGAMAAASCCVAGGAVGEVSRVAWVVATLGYGTATWIQRFLARPRAGAKRYAWSGPADLTHLATAIFAIAAGLVVLPGVAYAALWLHLWTVGVLVGTVAAVLLHLLPRFRRDEPGTAVAWIVAGSAVAAPVLLAWALHTRRSEAFAAAAAAMLLTLAALAVLVGATYAKRRNAQPFAPFALMALAAAVAGTIFGWGVGTGRFDVRFMPVHAIVQLLGFLGTMVVAMGSILLGTPRIPWRGRRVDPFVPVAGAWVAGLTLWTLWHVAAAAPRWLDVVPATLVFALGAGMLARARALGPRRRPAAAS